jgi:hypothetical protein
VDHSRQGLQTSNEIVHGKRKKTSRDQGGFGSVQSRYADILVDLQFCLQNILCLEIDEIRKKFQLSRFKIKVEAFKNLIELKTYEKEKSGKLHINLMLKINYEINGFL